MSFDRTPSIKHTSKLEVPSGEVSAAEMRGWLDTLPEDVLLKPVVETQYGERNEGNRTVVTGYTATWVPTARPKQPAKVCR